MYFCNLCNPHKNENNRHLHLNYIYPVFAAISRSKEGQSVVRRFTCYALWNDIKCNPCSFVTFARAAQICSITGADRKQEGNTEIKSNNSSGLMGQCCKVAHTPNWTPSVSVAFKHTFLAYYRSHRDVKLQSYCGLCVLAQSQVSLRFLAYIYCSTNNATPRLKDKHSM